LRKPNVRHNACPVVADAEIAGDDVRVWHPAVAGTVAMSTLKCSRHARPLGFVKTLHRTRFLDLLRDRREPRRIASVIFGGRGMRMTAPAERSGLKSGWLFRPTPKTAAVVVVDQFLDEIEVRLKSATKTGP
jgi:hypothetical protein